MAIDKVHGLQATGMSLNERFTLLSKSAPSRAPGRPQRRNSLGSNFNYNQNYMKNRNLIEQVARHLEMQAKRQAFKQRLGTLRRFGSESSLPGLRRSNSFSSFGQSNFKNRNPWRQTNRNFNWLSSFGTMWKGGFWRRGNTNQRFLLPRLRGGWGGGGDRVRERLSQRGRRVRQAPRMPQGGRGRPRGRGRGRGRGGMQRNQAPKPVPSREELDRELDQYMAGSKSALDKELDAYMENADGELDL